MNGPCRWKTEGRGGHVTRRRWAWEQGWRCPIHSGHFDAKEYCSVRVMRKLQGLSTDVGLYIWSKRFWALKRNDRHWNRMKPDNDESSRGVVGTGHARRFFSCALYDTVHDALVGTVDETCRVVVGCFSLWGFFCCFLSVMARKKLLKRWEMMMGKGENTRSENTSVDVPSVQWIEEPSGQQLLVEIFIWVLLCCR